MSKELSAKNLLSVFPPALTSSKNLNALASGIANELEILFSQNDILAIYTNILYLPEELLDILARDFKVDWYISDGTIESKRAQISSCFTVHRHLGTKYALAYALSDLCPGAKVQEWFEYDGEPGHFRIRLNAIRGFDFEKVCKAIDRVKRASAHMDGIEMYTTEMSNLYFGFATVHEHECKFIMDDLPFDWLVDEYGGTLTDEFGNILTET